MEIFFFLMCQLKTKKETYRKISEISKNNNYTTGNLLNNEYLSTHYKLIAKALSKQIELENPDLKQQFNFIGKLEMIEQQCFSSLRNQKKKLEFS